MNSERHLLPLRRNELALGPNEGVMGIPHGHTSWAGLEVVGVDVNGAAIAEATSRAAAAALDGIVRRFDDCCDRCNDGPSGHAQWGC